MYVTSCPPLHLTEAMEANMNESKKVDVPKFASFRPKAKVGSADSSNRIERSIEHHQLKKSTGDVKPAWDSHRSHERQEERHHRTRAEHVEGDGRHRRHRLRATEPKEQRVHRVDRQELQPVERDDDQKWFQVDRKGDPHNVIYGTIHRYNIPSYRRWGAGSVVGLPKRLKIDRDLVEGGITIDERHSSGLGKREKYSFARNERKPTRKLRVRIEAQLPSNELSDDFVPFSKQRGLKRGLTPDGESSVSEDNSDGNYRSIEGKAKSRSGGIEKDLGYASESSSDYEPINLDSLTANARARNIELSNKVELEPTNIGAWLDLIDHQDALLGLREGVGGRQATDAERRSTADIKISMYEKALSKVDKKVDGYERLLVGLMEEGSKIWEYDLQNTVSQ